MHSILAIASVTLALIVAIWDAYAVHASNEAQTVSSVIRVWSHRYPVIPLCVGVLIGHVFWGE